MKKNAVLLVEPADGRIQHTRLPWDAAALVVCNKPGAGLTAALTFRPQVILVSLRQSKSNGLQLARSLRQRLGSEPIIVVYGKPTATQRRVLASQRDQIRTRWGVDRLLAADPSGSRLGEVVQKLQKARLRRDGSLAMPEVPTPTEPQQPAPSFRAASMPLSVSQRELRAVMVAAVESVSEPRAKAPSTISERLLASFRALFQRRAA